MGDLLQTLVHYSFLLSWSLHPIIRCPLDSVQMSDAFFARKFNPDDEERLCVLSFLPSHSFVCYCSLIVLNKLDSIRQQREREENKMPTPSDSRSFGPLLMMAITDEISNHPDQLPLDGKYQCLQLPKKTGDDVLVTPCDTTNKLQYFTQGRVPPALNPVSFH